MFKTYLNHYERGEGVEVAAVGEDRLEPCELLLKPGGRRVRPNTVRAFQNGIEPLFGLITYCSLTSQRS